MKHRFLYTGYAILALALSGTVKAQAQEAEDGLVNVAFGKVAKEDLMGAVSTISVSDLQKKSYSSNSLDGLQSLVGGYNGNIWGQGFLVLVDGIPREASHVRASEVESVTVMKGANAVVLYGSRAAKGVVLITTKRGSIHPLQIDVRANTGMYTPKAFPNYLDAASYMTLYNEASRNDNIAERYSLETIYHTVAGTNPYRYPDVEYYTSEYLRKAYNRTDLTGELSGGTQRARYYTNFGMSYNNGLVKSGFQKKDYNLQFNLRSNVDINLSDWLTAGADAGVVYGDGYAGRGNFWGSASTFRPNWFSPLLPIDSMDPNNSAIQAMISNSKHIVDGKYMLGGTSSDLTNNFADMLEAGYVKSRTRVFLFNVNVGADLGMILEGLSFKTAYSVDYNSFYTIGWQENYAVYQPTWSNVNGRDMIINLTKFQEDSNPTSEYVGESRYTQTMSLSAQFNYKRTFNTLHHVSAALLGWGYQQQSSADSNHNSSPYHRVSNANLGIQAAYNYDHRYYADFSGAVVHSARLPEGKRTAFSPTLTLGWRLSGENFFKDNVSFVDDLKLTASYGKLNQDLDISDYYLYKGYYLYNNDVGWFQWRDGVAGGTTAQARRGDNPEMTFIQREEIRAGLEASLFERGITIDANFFMQDTKGLLTQGATIYPAYFSRWDYSYLPYLNFNNDRRTGFDFTVNLRKKIGQVNAQLGLAGMIYTSEATRRDEVYEYDYQYRAGKPLDTSWGYIAEGFFRDQADIDAHATQTFGVVQPGDLKYRDVNNDGVVDTNDQVDLGHNGSGAAPFTYGVNLTLNWKNLTLFVMGTGNRGAMGYKNSSYYWVRGNSKYSDVVLGRWTPETAATATYPRLTTTDNTNNFRNSTFWQYNTARFDLNKVQLTYNFPQAMFGNSLVDQLSLYVSGENLLTVSKERKHMETNIGSAPQYRFFNVGIKAAF